MREIAREMKALAERAIAGRLRVPEVTGGSFSISNLGMYGIDQFDAVINPPQCAILAVARGKRMLTVSEDGATRVATVLRATLSLDHSAIDGAAGAAFLQRLCQIVADPLGWLGSGGNRDPSDRSRN